MSQLYFAGETYEISTEFYEANKNCFIPLKAGAEDNKVMTTADIETKAPETETTAAEDKPKKKK